MASTGDEVEYESDPEEAKRSLAMRRREASDDEEGEGGGKHKRIDRGSGVRSDDSDWQGRVADYDDDEEEEEVVIYNEYELEEQNGVEKEVYEGKFCEGDIHGAEESVVPIREADSNLRSNLAELVLDHPGGGGGGGGGGGEREGK